MTRKAVLAVLVIVLGLLAGTATASTPTYTVDSTTDAPLAASAVGCQSTETTTADPSGTCTLRAAIQAADLAGGSSTISAPAGTYQLIVPATAPDDPSNGDLDVKNTGANPTVITIAGAGAGSTTIDAHSVDRAFAVDSGASLALSGVTVRHGTPSATSSGAQSGGAIYSAGVLTLTDDAFDANSALAAGGSGGAVDQTGTGGLTVRNTTFTSNTAAASGGAIGDSGTGVLTVTGDTFGAGMATGNNGGTQGGAIADVSSRAATIDDSTFTSNRLAPGSDAPVIGGGALLLSGSGYTLERDEFDANNSPTAGGSILWTAGALSIHSSSFVFNSAGTGNGGAVAGSSQGPLTLVDSTLNGNVATAGGGLSLGSIPVDLVNDTVWDNLAGQANGGNAWLVSPGLTANTIGVQNTLIGHGGASDPGATGISGPDCAAGSSAAPLPSDADQGHNFNPDASCLASTANGDQILTPVALGAPANHGGTVLTDSEPAGAPTIDAGTSATSVCPGRDARLVFRPQGSACDIGAYEFVPPPTPPATSTTTVSAPPATTTTTVTTASSTPPPGPGQPPIATTRGVLGARSTSAFLGGTVNAHSQATNYMFQVGTTRAYGVATVTGHTDVAVLSVDTLIQRLKPSTLYHYRLVATNAAGTSYGADRAFRTAPAYDGSVKLDATTLTVHGSSVSVPLTCASTKACELRFSIAIVVRLARTHKLGTQSFTKGTTTAEAIRAHRTLTVSRGVNPTALALLRKAPHHRLTGQFTTRPRTNQLGLISAVTLVLK